MRICTVIVEDLPIRVLATDSFHKDRLICFLHGWGDSADRWVPFLALAEEAGYGAVAFDWPGFGRSPRPRASWGVDEYARFLGAFINKYAKDSKEIVLVAHSMGARFAVRYVVEQSDRVIGLILTGAAGIPPERNRWRTFMAKTAKAIFSLPGFSRWYERVRDRFSSSDYRSSGAMRDVFRNIIAEDQRSEYGWISCPTLLLWGESDDQTPIADYRLMLNRIPNATGKTWPGGHMFFSDCPREFFCEITDFLKR